MNQRLEAQVLQAMYIAREYGIIKGEQRDYLLFGEIAELSGVGKSSLQRILPRLEWYGWIQHRRAESFDPKAPAMAVFHFKKGIDHMPEEIETEYTTQLPTLKRILKNAGIPHPKDDYKITYKKREISKLYEDVEQSYSDFIKENPRNRNKPFSGKAALFDRTMDKFVAKQYTFYQIIRFPFIDDSVFQYGKRVLMPLDSPDMIVPEGKRRFWYNAAKELLKEIEREEIGA